MGAKLKKMKTMKFTNEKGQFCNESSNHGFMMTYDFFTATAIRKGQNMASKNNNVIVKLVVKKTGKPVSFNSELFGIRMADTWFSGERWQYEGKDSNLSIHFEFESTTWREAFVKAKEYLFSEIERYEGLLKDREQALINAEF